MKRAHSQWKRKGTLAFITVVLIISVTSRFAPLSWAQSTEIKVTNPLTGDGSFIFYTNETSIGTRFNTTVSAHNVTNLFAYQVYLSVDDDLLNITDAWLPTWDANWTFTGQSTVQPGPVLYDTDIDGRMESARVGDSILVGEPFNGSGLLAIVEFEIIYAPPSGSIFCNLDIDNVDTYLLDFDLTEVSAVKASGYYEFNRIGPPVIATLTVEPSSLLATARGQIFDVDVAVSGVDAGSRLIGIQFRLRYNASMVSVLDVVEGPFLASFPQGPDPPFTHFQGIDEPGDPVYGDHVVVGDLLLPNGTGDYPGPFPEGGGLVATITFNVTGVAGSFGLELFDTLMIDDEVMEIAHELVHGFFEFKPLTLEVEPSSYIAGRRGETFEVSLNVEGVDSSSRLAGIQFRLRYNASMVSVLDVVEGPFLASFPQGPDPPFTYFIAYDGPGDPVYGDHVVVGDLLLPNGTGDYPGPFPEGGGLVATVTFNVTGVAGSFGLELFDTLMIDDEVMEIAHELVHGYYERSFNVTLTDQPNPSYSRTAVASIKFTVQYGDGTYYTADDFGSLTVGVHDGTDYIEDILLGATDFDPTTNKWTAKWIIPADALMLDSYKFTIRAHEIIDKFGDKGPLVDIASETFNITEAPSLPFKVLDVHVDVGSIHFKGEQAEIYILVTLDGIPVDAASIAVVLYNPGETIETLNAARVATGLYKAIYNITVTDPPGTYAIVAQASILRYGMSIYGSSLGSFQISSTLTELNPIIRNINGTMATIETTVGEVQLDLQAINATLVDVIVDDYLAVINSTVGRLTADLQAINATLVDVIVDDYLAVIDSTVGEIQINLNSINATLTDLIVEGNNILGILETTIGSIVIELDTIDANVLDIQEGVATIDTSLGEIQESLGGVQSTASTILYVTSILSAIAIIIGIVILLFAIRARGA